jgi:molecular chaperone GrpE
MDQQKKKKIEIEDKRHSANGAETAPLLEETQGSAAEMSADDAQAQAAMWQQQAEEYLELARRREAELRNALRRGEDDREVAVQNALEELIADLFPALDALAQAAGAYKDTADGENKLLDGVRATVKLLQKGLSKHGIEQVGTVGEPFDGHLHQALVVEDGEVERETVTEVYAEGYKMGERVLKPALVKVAKPA